MFFFFKQKTAYEMLRSLVGSEMCIRDREEEEEEEEEAREESNRSRGAREGSDSSDDDSSDDGKEVSRQQKTLQEEISRMEHTQLELEHNVTEAPNPIMRDRFADELTILMAKKDALQLHLESL
eukprot:TRINITY_DN22572_c0_g1_i1.p1 TRINITY_DN22572_c0_g1~~TRINITY_DN22572_c0_g1_i1.p1  ORF type:complete len:124 (+),score=53.14 TRINITY_DN22572_c0_g1_i1:50-421(+)